MKKGVLLFFLSKIKNLNSTTFEEKKTYEICNLLSLFNVYLTMLIMLGCARGCR